VLVACVALAVPYCASSGRSHAVKATPRCASVLAARPPQNWQRLDQGDSFTLFLPPSCVADRDGPQFVHGGSRWRCGTIGVDIVWGMWGPDSFSDREQQCHTTLSGLPALVSVRSAGEESRRIVWYLTGHIHEPLVSAWSTRKEDASDVALITSSATFTGTRGPNR
jgi:hypothetical protein